MKNEYVEIKGRYNYNIIGVRECDKRLLSEIDGDYSIHIAVPPSKFIANEHERIIGEYGARKIFMKLSDSSGIRIYC